MRKIYLLFLFIAGLTGMGNAQVTGIVNIPDEATLTTTITALNTSGVGAGGATLNFNASFNLTSVKRIGSATLNGTLSAANPLILSGNNNTLNAQYAGAATGSVSTGANDAMFVFEGTDYVTIQNLGFTEQASNITTTTAIENALAFYNRIATTPFDGCQNITISGCTFGLGKAATVGAAIYATSYVYTGTTNLAWAAFGTDPTQMNRVITVNNNTFNGSYNHVVFRGASTGANGRQLIVTNNTFNNIGGGASTSYGTYALYLDSIVFNNNTGATSTAQTATNYVAFASTSCGGVQEANNNNITLQSGATTSLTTGISYTSVGTNRTMNGNTITVGSFPSITSGAINGLVATYSGGNNSLSHQMNNNTFENQTLPATSGTVTILNHTSSTTGTGRFTYTNNNTINNISRTNSGILRPIDLGTADSAYAENNTITNITVTNNSASTASTIYGIFASTSAEGLFIRNNTINNINVSGTTTSTAGVLTGILSTALATGNVEISGNEINNLSFDNGSTGSATVIALSQAAAANANINKNKIYEINANNGAASLVRGIQTSGGTATNVFNNLIGNLSAGNSASVDAIRGINITSNIVTSAQNISYNTININTSSTGANFGTAGIFHTYSVTPTTSNLVMRNNIVVNTSVAAGTGLTVAFRRSAATDLNNYSTTSNNNLFFTGTPSATNLIYYDGTNSDQTVAAFIVRVTPRETASISQLPIFLSTTGSNINFLHIDPTIATQIESGGIPIGTITSDYDLDTRNATTPDIGADEFNGIGADLTSPAILYTPLLNSCTVGARTLVATITDGSGVPTSGAGLPTLYWKINAGAYTSEAATSLGSNQYQFTTLGTGTNFGDVVSYYIAAQDNAGTPNVAVQPSAGAGGFSTDPPAASTPPTTPNSYTVLSPLNGTYNVGAGQAYTTLTAAVIDYNTKCISGPVVFNLVDATYPSETYPITINANPGSSATNTLTIVPDAAIGAPILFTSAVATTATIELNGATYVTIDGRPGGAGSNKFIVIENTSTTLAASGNAILLRNEASNNTLTYLDLRSANINLPANTAITTAGAIPGAIAIGSTSGANGNDNNMISYCDVHSTATALLGAGIYAGNLTTAGNASNNDNNTITNCNVFDFFVAGSVSAGINIAAGNNNYTITNNSVYQTATRTYTGTQTVRGFWITPNTAALTSASGYTITGNYIGGSSPAGAGMTTMTATTSYLYIGMDISVGLGAATSIQGNTVNNINMTTSSASSAAMIGISIANGNTNTGTVTPNTIGNPLLNTAPYGITFTTTGTLGGLIGIRASGGGPHVLSNNVVAGIELIGSATTVAPSFNGINYSGGTTGTISNNTVGSATLPNSINLSATSATSTSSNSCRGIIANTSALVSTITGNLVANINSNYSGTGASNEVVGIEVATGSATVSGNTVRSLSSNSQGTGSGAASAMQGITITSTTAPQIVSGNNIYALKLTNPTATTANINQGLFFAGPTTGNNLIEKNNIHSISMASPTNSAGFLTGMDIGSGLVTIQNNMIRLGLDSSGASIVSPCTVRGITKNSAIAKIFHNSIYIGGTGVGTTATNTFAFARTGTASIDSVMNNIFVNERSNATTGGKHYQVNLNGTATLVLNYNVYYGTGTGNVFGFNGTVDFATFLPGWVAGDINSYNGNPQFINPTGSAVTGDLHINPTIASVAEGLGFNGLSVTDDFDAQTRSGLTPVDIGADAGNFISEPVMVLNSVTTTQTNISTIPTNSSNQQVIGIEVVTTGLLNPLSVTDLTINTNGTNNVADIANAKIFYTGTSGTFATTSQVGTTIPLPSGSFTITGTQQLSTGTNYFWLTYDIPCGATISNVVDAECTSVTIGSAQIPTVQAPAGTRTIISGPLSGIVTVGSGGTYPTLSAVVAVINSIGLGGNTTLNILSDITEPGQVVINQFQECGAGGYTLTIKPNTTATVSAIVNTGALIKLNGADRVVIDGSNNGTNSRNLTLVNSSTSTSASGVIWIASASVTDSAKNVTIKNCILNGNTNLTTLYGIFCGGTASMAAASVALSRNNNLTIQNNLVTKVQAGIWFVGVSSLNLTEGLNITGNEIGTAAVGEGPAIAGIFASLINAGNINSNVIQNIRNGTLSVSLGQPSSTISTGLYLQNSTNVLINGNRIFNMLVTGSGSIRTIAMSVECNAFNTISNPSNNTVSNNMIADLHYTGSGATTWQISGLQANGGYGDKFYYNSVSLTGTLGGAANGPNAAFCNGNAIQTTASVNIDVRNNIFAINGSNTVGTYYGHYSRLTAAAGTTVNYNDVYVNVSGGATGNYGLFNATTYNTQALWQAATTFDANSLNIAPVFVSATDLHLVPGSNVLLDNLGTPVSVTNDIDGDTRSATVPDMGADEFTAPLCVTAVGGTASGSGFGCVSYGGTITASGYSTGVGTTYQWVSAPSATGPWTAIGGANNPASYTISPVITVTTYYKLAVACATNSSVDSSTVVTITIVAKPLVPVTPAGPITICAPNTQTLNGGGTNAATPAYQWLRNNTVISGATNATYAAATTGSYRVRVTDGVTGCFDTSVVVVITVNPQPASPVAAATPSVVCIGANVNLTSSALAGYSMNPAGAETFIDIDANPTVTSIVTLGDDTEHNFNMPQFTFNGVTYTNARIGMNGVIVLGATTGEVTLTNAALPSTTITAGNIFLAPWWDDLDIQASPATTIKLDTVGTKFIIQYTNTVHNNATASTVKFQVQLDTANGNIHFVYDDVIFGNATYDAGLTATIGIQLSSTSALQYSFNTASLSAGQCISFASAPINYAWTGPNGFSSNLQNPVLTSVSSLDSGLYTVTFTNPVTTCTNTASVNVTVVPAGVIVWTGAVNTDWNNAGNWTCGGIPTISSEVIIPPGMPRYPLVNLNVEIKKLTINSGASVTIATGFDLKLNGN